MSIQHENNSNGGKEDQLFKEPEEIYEKVKTIFLYPRVSLVDCIFKKKIHKTNVSENGRINGHI